MSNYARITNEYLKKKMQKKIFLYAESVLQSVNYGFRMTLINHSKKNESLCKKKIKKFIEHVLIKI